MTRRLFLLLSILYIAIPYRSSAGVFYVHAGASGSVTNGLSWDTAFRKIQDAILASSSGDELWVAAGTYAQGITLKEGIALFGGFSGTETERNQRNWNQHKSILDGGRTGRVISIRTPVQAQTRVDGFVIRNGSSDFAGGVYSAGGNLVFANNLVTGNEAVGPYSGAGIFVDESATFPPQPLLTLFTTVSDRLLQAHSADLSSTHIPLYPTNRYTPEVHRLLQVAANICDATTNRGPSYPYYPSVFRPIFTNNNGAIAISGYLEAEDAQFISNTWLDLKLSQDRSLLTSDEVRSNANLYGQAIIIGAKKGFPNFNEFSMETMVQVVRKLELRKWTTNPLSEPRETNQMYLLGITNVFGVEAWNSYTNDFIRPIHLHVRHTSTSVLTNQAGIRLLDKTTTLTSDQLITNWPAVKSSSTFSAASYNLPFHTSDSLLPQSQYFSVPPSFQLATNTVFERAVGLDTPKWVLTSSNRLQYFAIDNGRVVDFVNLDGLTTQLDLTHDLLTLALPGEPMEVLLLWDTNRVNGLPPPTYGMLRQIEYSLGDTYNQFFWRDYSHSSSGSSIERQIDSFRYFLGLSPIFGTTNFTPTNRIIAPFSPMRTLYQKATWQANDPLVHFQAHDLLPPRNYPIRRLIIPPTKTYAQYNESNLGRLNDRLNPYFLKPYSSYNPNNPFGRNTNHISDPALQDMNIRWPEDWDFPSEPTFNLSWLDRVHRGTPWQTLFTGNSHHSASEWLKWSGSAETHPANDWSIIHNLLTNKSVLGATAASEWPPSLVNNTFAQNASPFPGAGVTLFSPAHLANNIVAHNDSGVALLVGSFELDPPKNLIAANRSDDLTGITSGEWNTAQDPQFVSAGNFHLRATSPAVDAGTTTPLIHGLIFDEPARSQGDRLDLGAYELSPGDKPVVELTFTAPPPGGPLSIRVLGFTAETYILERSLNLVTWQAIATNQTANGFFEHTGALPDSHQFYRAVRP